MVLNKHPRLGTLTSILNYKLLVLFRLRLISHYLFMRKDMSLSISLYMLMILLLPAHHHWQFMHFSLISAFAPKDISNLNYFLGIEVKQMYDGLLLTQEKNSRLEPF
jgi:hypothetical protein